MSSADPDVVRCAVTAWRCWSPIGAELAAVLGQRRTEFLITEMTLMRVNTLGQSKHPYGLCAMPPDAADRAAAATHRALRTPSSNPGAKGEPVRSEWMNAASALRMLARPSDCDHLNAR